MDRSVEVAIELNLECCGPAAPSIEREICRQGSARQANRRRRIADNGNRLGRRNARSERQERRAAEAGRCQYGKLGRYEIAVGILQSNVVIRVRSTIGEIGIGRSYARLLVGRAY